MLRAGAAQAIRWSKFEYRLLWREPGYDDVATGEGLSLERSDEGFRAPHVSSQRLSSEPANPRAGRLGRCRDRYRRPRGGRRGSGPAGAHSVRRYRVRPGLRFGLAHDPHAEGIAPDIVAVDGTDDRAGDQSIRGDRCARRLARRAAEPTSPSGQPSAQHWRAATAPGRD